MGSVWFDAYILSIIIHNMNWIIQDSNNEHKNWVRIYNSAILAGDSAEYINVDDVEQILSINKKSIVIGGDDFVDNCLKNPLLAIGIFRDDKFFNTENYVALFKNDFFNYDGIHISFGDMNTLKNNTYFIRPFKDVKFFDGGVYQSDDFIKQYRSILSTDELIFVSSPKTIICEWRFVVVCNSIITYYRYVGEKNNDDQAAFYVNSILHKIRKMPSALVIDIVYTPDGFKVLECNVINSSNFYECNIDKIVRALDDLMN